MSSEVLEHVFEPFFSTREIGQGSGMGLSMVHGFIHQSGGDVTVESRLGEGTQVCLYLPRVEGTPAQMVPPSTQCPRGHGERILVVEDHPLVRRVADWLLTRLGYETVLAMDGTQALELLDDEVDLLLTDIVMPGAMSGVELASEARKLRPKLPVLFTSGYSPEQFGINEAALLKKPFTAETLSRAVQQQLDTSPELCRDKS